MAFCNAAGSKFFQSRDYRGHRVNVCRTRAALETPLNERALNPLINESGSVAPEIGNSAVGVFAIFDVEERLRHIGISRDVATSLRRALARRPDDSWYYTAEIVPKPNRSLLEQVRTSWITQSAEEIDGCDGGEQQKRWESPINVCEPWAPISDEDREVLEGCEFKDRPRTLKKLCRIAQGHIEKKLQERGLRERLKFAPKLKDKGLLDLESVKIAVPDKI